MCRNVVAQRCVATLRRSDVSCTYTAQSSTRHRSPRLGLSQASIARPMCARIQTVQVSDEHPTPLPRPHSSGSGLHHGAPSFKRIRLASSCRALIQAEFIEPRCAPSFNGSDPTSCAPSIKPIQAPSIKSSRSPHDGQRPQSSNQAAPVDAARLLPRPAPSFKPFRSHPSTPSFKPFRS